MKSRVDKLPHIYYGGDYNPEQWSEDVWLDDMRLMKKAGVNLVSVGIFSWAMLQPTPDTYNFEWLDRLMDLMADSGIFADLATASASPPAWMARQFPDSLAVDENGVKYGHGGRQHYNPSSRIYREYSQKLARKLAERYKDHPALAMWHINNEYACHIQRDYSEQSAADFRVWLQNRYETLDHLNDHWGTNFWSQRYYEWEEIGLPKKTPTYANPCQQLDFARFMSDAILACYLGELRVLREITPDIPIMTNLMGTFKPLDYFEWAKHMDLVTWDSYPEPTKGIPVDAAMSQDLMRSLKGGQPFVLMEQVTSQVNWRDQNPLKRPGVMRLWSYQNMAHGSDGIMFFQWRAAKAGAEKFHGAMVTHSGDENSRVFKEVEQLGNELKLLDRIVDSRINAKVAIIFDWHNWWALELDSKPSADVKYIEQVMKYYTALYSENIGVDFVQPTGDLTSYDLVIAPTLYMVAEGVAENLEQFVSNGGTLLTTFFSGIVDGSDRIHLGGYPAPFRKLLGICVEEFDPMLPDQQNSIMIENTNGTCTEYDCNLWADIIRLEGAEKLATFTSDFFAGSPAVTVNSFGKGKALYVGTQPEASFTRKLIKQLLNELQISPPLIAPEGVEVTCREKDGKRYVFVLNHLSTTASISLPTGRHTDLITGKVHEEVIELGSVDTAILELQ